MEIKFPTNPRPKSEKGNPPLAGNGLKLLSINRQQTVIVLDIRLFPKGVYGKTVVPGPLVNIDPAGFRA
jgi:hypothetical protein